MPHPVCVKCNHAMIRSAVGVNNIELTERSEPYKVWSADEFECPVCGIQILHDFGNQPWRERFHPAFDEVVRGIPPERRWR